MGWDDRHLRCVVIAFYLGVTFSARSQLTFAKAKSLAEEGDESAQVVLGHKYLVGDEVPQDFGKSVSWLLKAAARGNQAAQKLLCDCYEFGRGVAKSTATARLIRVKLANEGDIMSQALLAVQLETQVVQSGSSLYSTPKELEPVAIQAYKWYTLAAAGGHKGSAESRDQLAQRLSPSAVAAAQALAGSFVPTRPSPWLPIKSDHRSQPTTNLNNAVITNKNPTGIRAN